MTLSEDDRRVLGLWAADCAERVLPLFEAKSPSDTRPREAIESIRAYARGGKRTGQLRSFGWAALAAARDVGDPVAAAAARAAGIAAATAYIHALATPHQNQVGTLPARCPTATRCCRLPLVLAPGSSTYSFARVIRRALPMSAGD